MSVLSLSKLAPNYAKMGSSAPSTSEGSLNSYVSHIAHFFQHINKLPWVADSRVTVDYYPGQSPRCARSRSPHRKEVLSWYNRHAFPPGQNAEPLDLDAESSPSPVLGQVVQMIEAQPSVITKEPTKNVIQPLILPTVPVPESQIESGPTYFAELIPPPPPRSDTQQSARTGRSIVYSVVNPSAPSTSTTTTSSSSPLTEPPRHLGIDTMTALAQSITGYTPYQPVAPQYGRPIHEPLAQVPVASSVIFTGDIREVKPAHTRTGTPAQSMYPYPLYALPTTEYLTLHLCTPLLLPRNQGLYVLTTSFHTSTQSQSPSSEMDAFNTFTTSAAVEDVVVEIPRDEEDSGSSANSSYILQNLRTRVLCWLSPNILVLYFIL
ncbi:hypothetical protein F5879DRAFT_1060232 [Lentinula edodes]|nr:hypothetical protein F5879DRAFT_1060232 [Lentinula edodes]